MTKIIEFAILTVSDSCTSDPSLDRSGPRLQQLINKQFPNAVVQNYTLPDEKDMIVDKLWKLVKWDNNDKQHKADVILTTGGTGFGLRDVTPEATRSVIERECPQMSMIMLLDGLKKTKYAALSRAVCGIAGHTLIINLPGAEKAVIRGFECVQDLLPHALNLLSNDEEQIRADHHHHHQHQHHHYHHHQSPCQYHNQKASENDDRRQSVAVENTPPNPSDSSFCDHPFASTSPCKTKEDLSMAIVADMADRGSKYEMLKVSDAIDKILQVIKPHFDRMAHIMGARSPLNVPGFRAAIKDGYAMKSSALPGTKKVLEYIAAGDPIDPRKLNDDECFKINTGAPLPADADCVVQIEDTQLLRSSTSGKEDLVEILVEPKPNLDVRPIGCDLHKGVKLFPIPDLNPVVMRSMLATVGQRVTIEKLRIAILITGNELLQPGEKWENHLIYDTNTPLLQSLLEYFGFTHTISLTVTDDFEDVLESVKSAAAHCDVLICSGGVSMGDKDYIKPALEELRYDIHFGRVDMKPGKPMTFASKDDKYFFGLPGNPVSTFVTFHLFVLPALRRLMGTPLDRCRHPLIPIRLGNDRLRLDSRPEFMRASVTCRKGQLYAEVTGNQMSSRLQSIVGADVLLHLPARSEAKWEVLKDELLQANTLRYDFISEYQD